MESLLLGGGPGAPGCYALLSRDANVLDLSRGMRDLCRRFRPQSEVPQSFKTLIVERDHPLLLEHLERVWLQQQSDSLHLEVARTFGAPLKARIFSVPAPREKAVQAFLWLEGREASSATETSAPAPSMPVADLSGFMVLRADGDFQRLIISFCDARCRAALGVEGGALAERSIFQVLPAEACQSLTVAVREARATGEPRRCTMRTRKGTPMRALVFISNESVILLTENDPADLQAANAALTPPERGRMRAPGTHPAVDAFFEMELRPGLRALRNLARSLKTSLPENMEGARRVKILEELSSQICDAVEAFGSTRSESVKPVEEEDVLRRLVEGVRDVVHPALSRHTHSVAIIDEVAPGSKIISPYGLTSLQQVLVDLVGEASSVVPHSAIECSIRQTEEMAGRVVLGFEVCARSVGASAGRVPGATQLERRPMFKGCRRFLKALGAQLELEADDDVCLYRFSLPFGKRSALGAA